MTWQQEAVAHLRESKAKGFSWTRARKLAAAAVRIPDKDAVAASLFEQQNTQAGFFWRVAEDAYLDRGSKEQRANLRAFAEGMLDDDGGAVTRGIAA